MSRVKISYVGDKPTISPNGIYFNHSKPDKYIYLQAVGQILTTLIEMGNNNEKFVEYFDLSQKYSDSQILDLLYRLKPDFDQFYAGHIDSYERKIKAEEEEIDENSGLSEMEKSILENNYHLMFDYRIQRARNKLVYEELVNSAVDIIKDKRIASLKAIFTREFFHVLQSIKTTLELQRGAPNVSLKFIDTNSKEPELELKIEFIKKFEG